MEPWRDAVVTEARTWKGTPFAHQQRLKGVGADCAQWISAVYEHILGWPRQDFGNYPAHWMKHGTEDRYMDHVRRLFDPLSPTETPALPGDLVVFRFGRFFSHGAILTLWPLVIHADAETGKVVCEEDLTKAPLGRRARQFWTPKLIL